MNAHTIKCSLLLLLLAQAAYAQNAAKRNTEEAGLQIGMAWAMGSGESETVLGNMPPLNLLYEYNFDKNGNKWYLSLGGRLHTCKAEVFHTYKQAELVAGAPAYPKGYRDSAVINMMGIGISPSLNYTIFRDKNFMLRTQLSVVPFAEFGDFTEGTRLNMNTELYFGMLFANRLGMGMRANYTWLRYTPDEPLAISPQRYSILCLLLDFRYRFKK
ncbi:hypothetical protein CAP35_13285 [Chitinophagaceae bacterium IBVUCB1]|nr:hypothetical protein CAP35_13285 [Chitinophagaceae bacterium IBVUCB1]